MQGGSSQCCSPDRHEDRFTSGYSTDSMSQHRGALHVGAAFAVWCLGSGGAGLAAQRQARKSAVMASASCCPLLRGGNLDPHNMAPEPVASVSASDIVASEFMLACRMSFARASPSAEWPDQQQRGPGVCPGAPRRCLRTAALGCRNFDRVAIGNAQFLRGTAVDVDAAVAGDVIGHFRASS